MQSQYKYVKGVDGAGVTAKTCNFDGLMQIGRAAIAQSLTVSVSAKENEGGMSE